MGRHLSQIQSCTPTNSCPFARVIHLNFKFPSLSTYSQLGQWACKSETKIPCSNFLLHSICSWRSLKSLMRPCRPNLPSPLRLRLRAPSTSLRFLKGTKGLSCSQLSLAVPCLRCSVLHKYPPRFHQVNSLGLGLKAMLLKPFLVP